MKKSSCVSLFPCPAWLPWPEALFLRILLTALIVVVVGKRAYAAEWHVAPDGIPANSGKPNSPWDLDSTLQGNRSVEPGDTVWLASGTYKHPDRKRGAMGYAVHLAGSDGHPIHVRAISGQRATIDGGLNVQPPSTHLWFRDLELIVSENLAMTRRFDEPGSSPKGYDRPWGGLNVYSGKNCRFINLVIHDNAQGVSWWAGSKESELHGCIIYDNGWEAPDRGHGHAIYTQNNDGIKTISDCILTGGHGYTLHAYGSSRADVNNYLVTGNICYNGGPFLIGSGRPSRNIRVLTNFLYRVSMRIGYNAPHNEDCEMRGNWIIGGNLAVEKYKSVTNEDNRVLSDNASRPSGTNVFLLPNRYDSDRANLVVFNWDKRPSMEVQLNDFLRQGERFRILHPREFFGKPILEGNYDGQAINVPVRDEFAAFVLIKLR
ncbi:MAG: hypothetical protein HY735_03455 [Verrucomicrobia bacterium]|nr:hypothetical protein [Verrucomicrobiota bacterium]